MTIIATLFCAFFALLIAIFIANAAEQRLSLEPPVPEIIIFGASITLFFGLFSLTFWVLG
ncbi:MAG: hypothetical protein AAF618_00310 [Pseudomonadota bacterium]